MQNDTSYTSSQYKQMYLIFIIRFLLKLHKNCWFNELFVKFIVPASHLLLSTLMILQWVWTQIYLLILIYNIYWRRRWDTRDSVMWLGFFLCFYLLSWALTTSEPDQSSSCPLKPPWLTPQIVGRTYEPSDSLYILCVLRIPNSMRYLGGPSGRQSTAGTSWIHEALHHSNHSGFPKAAR